MRIGRTRGRGLTAAILSVVVGLGGEISGAAAASGERHVVLSTTGCPAGAETEIRRMVGMEIGDLLVEVGTPLETDRLAVVCTEDAAHLLAQGSCLACEVDRTLRLNDFPPDAVARALALAGVELLASLSPAVRRRLEARAARPDVPVTAAW